MTQSKLLDIAIREFGQKGLEGASTRGIAAAAGTAMSSITYHYGGKEGLYLAAADHIAQQMPGVGGSEASASVIRDKDATAARAMIKDMLAKLLEKMTGAQSEAWSLFIIREQANPTEAFERIYAGPMGQMMETLVALVRTAIGDRDDVAARVAVVTLFGQVVVTRAARATCLRVLDRPAIDTNAIAALTMRIAANTDAILDRMIAERQEPQ